MLPTSALHTVADPTGPLARQDSGLTLIQACCCGVTAAGGSFRQREGAQVHLEKWLFTDRAAFARRRRGIAAARPGQHGLQGCAVQGEGDELQHAHRLCVSADPGSHDQCLAHPAQKEPAPVHVVRGQCANAVLALTDAAMQKPCSRHGCICQTPQACGASFGMHACGCTVTQDHATAAGLHAGS